MLSVQPVVTVDGLNTPWTWGDSETINFDIYNSGNTAGYYDIELGASADSAFREPEDHTIYTWSNIYLAVGSTVTSGNLGIDLPADPADWDASLVGDEYVYFYVFASPRQMPGGGSYGSYGWASEEIRMQSANVPPTANRFYPSDQLLTVNLGSTTDLTIRGRDDDGNLSHVRWILNGDFVQRDTLSGSQSNATYSYHADAVTSTRDSVTAIVYDTDGEIASASWFIEVIAPNDPNDQISEATSITKPEPGVELLAGISDIDSPVDVDMYEVTVGSGDRLGFDLDDYPGFGFDSVLRLFNSSGQQLAVSDDDSAPGESSSDDAYLEYTFASGGTYYIGISGYPNTAYNPLTGTGDTAGSEGLCYLYVTNLRPTVSIVAPSDSTPTVALGSTLDFTIHAEDIDGNLHDVDWYVDGDPVFSEPLSGSSDYSTYTHTFGDVGTGTTDIVAIVHDSDGLTASGSSAWFVTVTAPAQILSVSHNPSDETTANVNQAKTVTVSVGADVAQPGVLQVWMYDADFSTQDRKWVYIDSPQSTVRTFDLSLTESVSGARDYTTHVQFRPNVTSGPLTTTNGTDTVWSESGYTINWVNQSAPADIIIETEDFAFNAGDPISITGIVVDDQGNPLPGVEVGAEDHLLLMSRIVDTTDANGRFSLAYTPAETSAAGAGLYAATLILPSGDVKESVTFSITESSLTWYEMPSTLVSLGPTGNPEAFDPRTAIWIPNQPGFSIAIPDESVRLDVGREITEFSRDWLQNFGDDFFYNPVNQVAFAGAATCVIPSHVCAVSAGYLAVSGIKQSVVSTLDTIIDHTSMSAQDKADAHFLVDVGKALISVMTLNPDGSVFDYASVAWNVWSVGTSYVELERGADNQVTSLQIIGSGIGSNPTVCAAVFLPDDQAPQASLIAPSISMPGGTPYVFAVEYSDNEAIDVSTLGNADLLIDDPNGPNLHATFVSATPAANSTTVTATYQYDPPGGTWDAADNGTYDVWLQFDEVFDTSGNPVQAALLGSFTVAIGNQQPTATIDDVSPNPAQPPSQQVVFSGHGTDHDGSITAWEWTSDIDGVLSASENFSVSSNELTVGAHQISYRVRDNDSAWSAPVSTTLVIADAAPVAQLGGLPTVSVAPGVTISLNLDGHDNDEGGQSIQASQLLLDGGVIDTPSLGAYQYTAPSAPGSYSLSFQVLDDEGSWSAPVSGSLVVEQPAPASADYDEDGDVDGSDFLAWQRGFGTAFPNAGKADGDSDNDLDVDADDLSVWNSQYGGGADTGGGLIAHYAFDGTDGAVIDAIGNYDGVNNGATRGVPGIIGNAFLFDGLNDFVDTIPASAMPATGTIGLWVYPTHASDTTPSHGDQLLGTVANAGGGKDGITLNWDHTSGTVDARYYEGNAVQGEIVVTPSNLFPIDNWTYLAYTWDSSNDVELYADGVLAATGNYGTPPTSHDRALMIGKSILSQDWAFDGLIDDVKVWDRPLGAAEIEALASEVALNDGLVAYFPFDGDANEATGNSNDGIIHGAILTTDRFGQPNSAYYLSEGTHIEVPRSAAIEPTHELSISLWATLDYLSPSPKQNLILSKRLNTAEGFNSYIIGYNKAQDGTAFYLNSGEGALSPQPLTQQWTHIAGIYDGSHLKLYQDGALVSQVPHTGDLVYSNLPLWIGMTGQWDQFWNGSVDEVRIYDRALSDADVAALASDTIAASNSSAPSFAASAADSSGIEQVAADLAYASLAFQQSYRPLARTALLEPRHATPEVELLAVERRHRHRSDAPNPTPSRVEQAPYIAREASIYDAPATESLIDELFAEEEPIALL